ncbi:hypothetical protein C0J50_12615 [Silurus asotus]|uniref:Uncharacterized protein n=1 Tax=Silurus asotus TaxID=30991 RepID=A0AAD5B7L5_SILAS|nr:hypothetical protein C0J50_12615 [Silurus asotus]
MLDWWIIEGLEITSESCSVCSSVSIRVDLHTPQACSSRDSTTHTHTRPQREKENRDLSGTWVAGKRPEIPTSHQYHITE